jgi:hypothetical protein
MTKKETEEQLDDKETEMDANMGHGGVTLQ